MSSLTDLTLDTNQRANVNRKWISHYGLLYFATCVSWAAPSQILLGTQMSILDPSNKSEMLGWLMTIGGTSQVITTLFAGTLSDRTRSRLGKRLPWIIIGILGASMMLVALSFTPNYWTIVAAWSAFQFFTVLSTNNILTLTPDTVPQRQYGIVSGILGATYTLGLVVGSIAAALLPLRLAYLVIVGLFIGIMLFYLASGTWKLSVEIHQAEASQRAALKTQIAQARSTRQEIHKLSEYRDFFWVFTARFVVHLGNYVTLFYLLFYLEDHIGLRPTATVLNPGNGVMILTLVYALFTVLSAIFSGKWSDRLGRRKVFVICAALLAGGSAIAMSFVNSFPLVIVAAVALGLAWGTFTSVDQALISEVLPYATTRARDMSIMTLTVGITNMLTGITAAMLLKYLGGYPGLYLTAGLITIFGAFLVLPVKRSK